MHCLPSRTSIRPAIFAALAAAGLAMAAASPRGEADREPDAGIPEHEREVDGPLSGGGIGRRVVVIEVHGTIDLGLSPFIRRTLERPAGADLVILDINTPGGRVDAALEIRDALLESEVRTAAFIHPRAISAGALISYACEIIAIAPGGSIGAATPVAMGPGGGASDVGEKMKSYFRAEMASTARARGRRGDIAEAMVDPDVEIEGVSPSGKLLTLDTDGAVALGVADFVADDVDALLRELHLDGAEIDRPRPSWAENVARALTHPAVAGLLMAIGMLGILIELYTPGFGAPGIVGIACLVVFFFGHFVVHLAGWEELILFSIGLVLLAVEIFVTPGFGILGVLGIAAVLGALALALVGVPFEISLPSGAIQRAILRVLASAAGAAAAFALVVVLAPRTRLGRPLVLGASLPRGSSLGSAEEGVRPVAVGDAGTALTILRPAGRVLVGGRSIMASSDGEFIDRGRPVVVVRLDGDTLLVRERKP